MGVTVSPGIKNTSENYMYLIPKASILCNEETPAWEKQDKDGQYHHYYLKLF